MAVQSLKTLSGPLLVGFAAFLWATDALIRYPAIDQVDPTFIVFIEHALAVLILFPWLYFKNRNEILSLSPKEWLAAIFSGMGGSAIGTVFFTASFLYINPSVAVLLQKLQPVMVVLIAYLFLGERPDRKFYIWGLVALGAAIVLSFPDMNFRFLTGGMDIESKGVQYAFGAALLWAASTVSGKILLKKTSTAVAVFWRFFFGLIALIFLMAAAKTGNPFASPGAHTSVSAMLGSFWNPSSPMMLSVLYLSLVPGLLAMVVYYSGLSRTPASVTTFIELVYPIGAVILNTAILHTPLLPVQTFAGLILVGAVAMMSW
jgi:drug/metabolite transporter (DMT)-like permease